MRTGAAGGSIGVPGISGGGLGGPGGAALGRYNPVFDDLSRGTIAEDMVPKDVKGQNRLWRYIYLRDTVGGPRVDIVKELAYSDFTLTGVKDKAKLKIYEDAKDAVKLPSWLPEISGERLVMGRVVVHMLMDESKGFWTDLVIHDPDYLQISAIPISGADAKIDLLPSPALRQFMLSRDPRDIKARARLSNETIALVLANRTIPLNPENTAFLKRRGSPNDHAGVSLYSRMINPIAIEKALTNGEIAAARRWLGPRLHVEAGIPNGGPGNPGWHPTNDELQNISDLFLRAEEDPVGALVVTHLGVKVNDLGNGKGRFWTLEDSWPMLQEAKMRAVGISEAVLSGDATYSNMEHAHQLFFEQMKGDRDYIKNEFVIGKFYTELARAHEFYKRPQHQLDHGYRTRMSDDQLDLPDLDWQKQLQPSRDLVWLDILERMEAKGAPVGVRDWTAAGGLDYDKMKQGMVADLKERSLLRKYWRAREQLSQDMPDKTIDTEEAEDAKAQKLPAADDIPTLHARLQRLPVWRNNEFLGIDRKLAAQLVHDVLNGAGLRNGSLDAHLRKVHRLPPARAEVAKYLLARVGAIAPTTVPREVAADMVSWLAAGAGDKMAPTTAREVAMIATSMERPTEEKLELGRAIAANMRGTRDFTTDRNVLEGYR